MRISFVHAVSVPQGLRPGWSNWHRQAALPPIELAQLAAIARQHHHEVNLHDVAVDPAGPREVIHQVKRFQPDLLIIDVSPTGIPFARQLCHAMRAHGRPLGIVGVGMLFSLFGAAALKALLDMDAAIVGESEHTFEQLTKEYEEHRRIAGFAGVVWRDDSKVYAGPRQRSVEDLDDLPMPARDLLNTQAYRCGRSGQPFTLISPMRGCAHQCIFCMEPARHGPKVRRHTPSYVVTEIGHCVEDLGIHQFTFADPSFVGDPDYAHDLCDGIRRRHLSIYWSASARPDAVEPKLLNCMKHAGCRELMLGLESGSQAVLDASGKGTTLAHAQNAVSLCRAAGIHTVGCFVMGLPGETPATATQTIRFAMKLGLNDVRCVPAAPLPPTPLGRMARDQSWINSGNWIDLAVSESSVMNNGTIEADMVDVMCQEMHNRFYSGPGQWIRRFVGSLAGHA